jgi:hypothetical protein
LVLAFFAHLLPQGRAQDTRGFPQVSTAARAPANGNYYALVIGINEYPAGLPSLKTAVNDANAVGQLLHDRYGFDVRFLLDRDATRANILTALHKFRSTLGENDSLLIYYGGHGYSDKAADKVYWLPADAESADSPSRIIVDDLTSEIRALPARHVLVVSDSCYAGGLSRDVHEGPPPAMTPKYLMRELGTRSRTLMASGGDEPVSDSGSNGHSVFANAVLKALEREDDPMFSAQELFYESVRKQVAGNSDQIPEYAPLRNSSDDGGDFIFSRKDAPAPPATAPLLEALTPERANALIASGTTPPRCPCFRTHALGAKHLAAPGSAYFIATAMGWPRMNPRP